MSPNRDELHRLVDELSESEVPGALRELQERTTRRQRRGVWPPPWFGIGEGSRTDVAARSEELLRDGFGR